MVKVYEVDGLSSLDDETIVVVEVPLVIIRVAALHKEKLDAALDQISELIRAVDRDRSRSSPVVITCEVFLFKGV